MPDPYDTTPRFQLHWPDADQAPVSAIRVYVNTRARAFKERVAGAIDRALVTEQRAEDAAAEVRLRIDPEAREDLAALFSGIESAVDDLCAVCSEFDAPAWRALLPDTRAGRCARETTLIERSLGNELVPRKADGDVLLAKGHDPRSWAPYIRAVAEDYGVSITKALAVWNAFGPTEAFDGFVTTLGDYEGDGE